MAENMDKTFTVVLMLVGIIFLSGCIATDKDIDEITKQAKEKYAGIEDYQVDVVLTPNDPFTGGSMRFVMREKFKQPNKYVAEIIESPKDVGIRTVSDGVFVWRENPSLAYIERASLDSRGVPKPFDFTSALQYVKQFSEFLNIEVQGIESIDNRMAYKLIATPKEKELAGQFSAHVWIDSERLIPLKMSWPGMTINYTNIKINEGIPDNSFSVPEGQLVVEAENIPLGFLWNSVGGEKIRKVESHETRDASMLSITESVTCGNESIDAGETAENCCPDVRGEADEYCKVWLCMSLEEYEGIRSEIENYSMANFEVVEPEFLPKGIFLASFKVLEYRPGVNLKYKRNCQDFAFEMEILPGEPFNYVFDTDNDSQSVEETEINDNPGHLIRLKKKIKNVDTEETVLNTIYWHNEEAGINFNLHNLGDPFYAPELGEQLVQIAESIPSVPKRSIEDSETKDVKSEPIDKCKDVQCGTYQTCVEGECIVKTPQCMEGGDCAVPTCKEANGYVCDSPSFCKSESYLDLEGKVCCRERCKS